MDVWNSVQLLPAHILRAQTHPACQFYHFLFSLGDDRLHELRKGPWTCNPSKDSKLKCVYLHYQFIFGKKKGARLRPVMPVINHYQNYFRH